MLAVDSQPKLTELRALIAQVPRYPISVRRLLRLASYKHAKPAVINFYKEFPQDQVFSDRDDILARTEQIDIMRHEDPPEEFFRGFED